MRRETQNLLLLLLGGALLKLAFTGGYLRYVKPALLPWLVLAGAAIAVLAAVAIVRDIRTGIPERHGEHDSRSSWLLLLPVFAVFLVAPPALGSDSVTRASTAAPERASRFEPLPPGEAPLLSVSEFHTRAVWDNNAVLSNRTVRLHGFVVHAESGEVQLARLRMSCCAADAAPVRVRLAGPLENRVRALPNDTWIEVTGRLRSGSATEATGYVPRMDLTVVRTIPAPPDPYEY